MVGSIQRKRLSGSTTNRSSRDAPPLRDSHHGTGHVIRRSVAFFQAQDVGDDIVGIVALDHNVRHGAMRGLQRRSQRCARQAWSFAIASKLGALGLGELPATLSTRWHWAHVSRANLRPC